MKPLKTGQLAMWYAYKLNPEQSNFITAEYVQFDKNPDVQLLQRAIQYTFEQVEVFHQQYVECEEQVFQRFQQKEIHVPIIEVHDEAAWMDEVFRSPLALEQGTVFYTALLHNSETQKTTWYLKVHHIATDAFAYQLLYHAVATQYKALLQGNQEPLSDVFDSYEAVLEEETQYEESTQFLEDRAFWKTYMQQRQEIAAFSPKQPTLLGDVIRASTMFSVEDVQKWNKESFLHQVSPQHYFMSAFALLAYKIAHKKEVVINMPLMQRFGSKAANVPCLHMNMVPLRIRVDAEKTLLQLASDIKNQEMQIKQHGAYPFEQIKREAGCHYGERICSGQLNFMPFYETITFGDCFATTYKQSIGFIDDLSLNLFGNAEGGLQCELLANADLYTTEQLTQWMAHFNELLHQQTLPAFETLRQVIEEEGPYNYAEDVVSMIERHAQSTPQAIAIQSEAGDWTYERLWHESNQMAEWLTNNGVDEQDFVALYLPRTPELLSCMIAVLKIQATYIPMDPIYPKERIEYMMQDAHVKVMIGDSDNTFDVTQLRIGERPWSSLPGQWVREDVCPTNLAYMIYTSGSTGNPKGVMIERHNVSNFLVAMQNRLPITREDALLAVTTNAFDISMLECFLPLCVGAKVVLTTSEQIHDPLALAKWIETKKITFIQATPSLWKSLVKFIPQHLTSIVALVGGEVLSTSLAESLLQTTKQLFNMYGPTETTIWSTMAHITNAAHITLGQPIDQTTLYILDEELQPVVDGTEGQLYIAGEGVGRGYYGRKALTAERFIANPFHEGSRMYQTGDLVKRQDEDLYYIGRTDFQVKIRGFRVELVEIERALEKLSTIEEALVMLRDERLIAYYIGTAEIAQVKEALRRTLPEYMVPDDWCCLEQWPLTANGKIDRLALPTPHMDVVEVAFENDTEEKLAALYASILHVNHVVPTSHFFKLGGHSILATSLMMAIRENWQVDVTIATIFEYPTVRALASVLFDENYTASLPTIEEVEQTTYVPLSTAQKGMWFMQQTNPSATYNIPLLVEHFSYDLVRVREALAILQRQHPMLRTTFHTVDGVPMQAITEQAIPVEIASALDLDNHIHTIFDLEKELSLRVFAYEEGLLFLFHHIAIDGFGLSLFLEDFTFAYEHLQPRTEPKSYAAFVEWQRKLLATDKKEQGLDYWAQQLKDVPEEITLPYDEGQSAYEGAHLIHEMPEHLVRASQELAKEQGVSLYTVLQTAFTVLLHKMGVGNDFTIGSPTVGRPMEALQDMLGLMMNTIVYRYDIHETETFERLLQKNHHMNKQAYTYDFIPFDQVVERVNPRRTTSKNPLFQLMLTMQNTPPLTFELPEQQATVRLLQTNTAKVELALEFDWQQDQLTVIAEYDPSKFTFRLVNDLLQRFEQLLIAVTKNVAQKAVALPLLLPGEKVKLCKQSTPNNRSFSQETIVSRFERIALKQAERTAVKDGAEMMTYRTLNERANRLAHYLRAKGVEKHDPIALVMDRQIDMIVSILAVLKVGAMYVPIDPQYPSERVQYILETAQPRFTLVDEARGYDAELIVSTIQLHEWPATNVQLPISPEDAAYVIFTSGSTGKPKGVVIPHNNVHRLLRATDHWFHFDENDCWTFFHSYAFDFSIWEIWGALLTGGQLLIVPFEVSRTPRAFHSLVVEEGVTILNQTPSAFYQFIEADQEAMEQTKLRCIVFGGEALSFERLKKWYAKNGERVELINMYGITETTVHVSYQRLSEAFITEHQASLIGEAIPDLEIYVLDAALQPVPAGVTGEMYVAGDGLAQGYLGRMALTAERFIANPFKENGSRMYRTGDLAKWTSDGNLAYIGRIDHQVKIRGFRIELEEIERALLRIANVREVAVVTKKYRDDDVRILAYVIADDLDQAKTMQQIAKTLPNYMMPNALIELEEMPLTANGKLNTAVLPEPVYNTTQEHPTNPTEEVMLQLFRTILDNDSVGIHDSFFEVGGHSLLAVQLMTQIKQTFDVELAIGHLFEAPTVHTLCESMNDLDEGSSLQPLLPLRKTKQSDTLFCVHPAGGLSWCYAGLMQHLPQQMALYGLQAVGIAEETALPTTLIDMATNYITEIRKVQPFGPYELLGWSLGGNVVQEMAVQLEALGEDVHLIILDAFPVHHKIGNQTLEEEAVEALLTLGGLDVSLVEGEATLPNVVAVLKKEGSALASLSEQTLQRLLTTYMNSITLLRSHVPRPCHADVLFYESTIIPEWFEKVDPHIWEAYCANITIESIACRHKDMCQPGPIKEIGQQLARYFKEKGMKNFV